MPKGRSLTRFQQTGASFRSVAVSVAMRSQRRPPPLHAQASVRLVCELPIPGPGKVSVVEKRRGLLYPILCHDRGGF